MRENLKIVKGIFGFIVFLIMAGCAGILVCAFNPSLTEALADKIGNGSGGQAAGSQYGEVQPGINANWMSGGQASYEIPDGQPAQPPASVSGRTGYEPVQEDSEQILQEEADNLSESVAVGETGAGLSFDEGFYPYYAMLQTDLKQLYNQIYANAQNATESFAPVVPVSVQQLKSVFEAVYNDHPELFWLDAGYSCKYLSSGSIAEITLKYNGTVNNLQAAKQDFANYAMRIVSAAGAFGSNAEKEKYVHDALMTTVDYELDAYANQSAYSALVRGRSVCAGYARAFQYVMQQLGIPCYYCTGYSGEDHAWNIVKLDDDYYNVDVTWDDTDPPTDDYFNKSDQEFAGTHVRTGLSVYLPACMAGSGTDASEEEDGSGPSVLDLINPDPIEPLEWQSKNLDVSDTGLTSEEKKQIALEEAGLTEDDVRESMEEYYEDCKKLLKEAGVGDKKFTVVIPETLWSEVESAYGNGDYWEAYVNETLKEFGVDNFMIYIQIEYLGDVYYRVYHNVLTY